MKFEYSRSRASFREDSSITVYDFRMQRWLFRASIALVIPMYLIMVKLHLLDSRLGLIVVYCSFATPFVLWIMGNYFQTIPRELEDAARVDGCTRIGALFRVILSLARPGLLSTALFAFLIAWDEFLYALIFTSTTAAKTIPVAIAEFTGRYTTDFGLQAAGGILAALPPVLRRANKRFVWRANGPPNLPT